MTYNKKLGIFVEMPNLAGKKNRLISHLSGQDATELFIAFFKDLMVHISKMKKLSGTVFFPEGSYDC